MTTAAPRLDQTDAWLLDTLQRRFPVVDRPWEEIGRPRGLSGADVLGRVQRLKRDRIIRQISPIFDSAALGYTSMLVAAQVDEERIGEAAAIVNEHPGVSHNYRREASYNLWFTLAVPPGERIEDHLAKLAQDAGLKVVRPMPSLRTFHIGVVLAVGEQDQTPRAHQEAGGLKSPSPHPPVKLTERDKRIIALAQDDLPLVEKPFADLCAKLGLSLPELAAWFEKMKTSGALRRFAAILRHRSTGFVANGMVCWQVPEASIEAAGAAATRHPQVSHCYQRPSYPDWPYNLYTMIHARSRQECEEVVARIASDLTPLGAISRRVLYSTDEYKKQRVRYFV